MKISQLLPKSQSLAIKFPDGEDTGITLQVVGQDSKQAREVIKKFAVLMDDETSNAARLAQMEARAVEMVSACIVGWSGLDDEDGQPLPYSHEAAVNLVSKPELAFIAEQVLRYAGDRQNFFRRGHQEA